jgi:lipooligosaccharide transport system ATP-binding protein
MKTDPSKIIVEHVHKTYGKLKAVDDLSFTVNPSICYGFLGPNGAGKTTMMKILYGKATRDSDPPGTISVFGFDPMTHELDIKYFSGVVPQEDNLDDELNVIQNLKVFARFYRIPRKTSEKRIHELLNFMELSDRTKSKIRELSGGMKRRLIIARALLNNPRLLILDEPTTGLDPQVRHVIWDKIRNLKKKGITVLLTTHYMEEAFQIADRIMIMDKGQKVMEGHPKKLVENHIEPFVMEVTPIDGSIDALDKLLTDQIRKDDSGDTIRFYAKSSDLLRMLSRSLKPGEFHIRPSNLEDLFLKTTGRNLNAGQ